MKNMSFFFPLKQKCFEHVQNISRIIKFFNAHLDQTYD